MKNLIATAREKLELTVEQKRAFKALQRAFKRCKTLNITFYNVLGNITALNGTYISRIHDGDGVKDYSLFGEDELVLLPSIEDSGLDSWSDDKCYIEFLENEMTS